jgi:chromosome partitioning protein
MSAGYFPFKKALQVFGSSHEHLIEIGVNEKDLPEFARSELDNRILKSWSYGEMPSVGKRVGFMKKPTAPIAVAVFVTKGGVLKSSLTLNIARMAALHDIRTCVVGLDMQGDVSSALGGDEQPDDNTSLQEAVAQMSELRGLADVFAGDAQLADVIRPTDIPTLFYIPETPELVALDQSLINRNRREYWLRESIIEPLKKNFDLILMDCSPNWNRLITNALVACDTLVSPLECKINNFRNFKAFRQLLIEFRNEMGVDFTQIFIPTRLSSSRKLSREIFDWYIGNLNECSSLAVRESVQGEESIAMRLSIPEHAPTSTAADEMRELMKEIWSDIIESPRLKLSRLSAQRTANI